MAMSLQMGLRMMLKLANHLEHLPRSLKALMVCLPLPVSSLSLLASTSCHLGRVISSEAEDYIYFWME